MKNFARLVCVSLDMHSIFDKLVCGSLQESRQLIDDNHVSGIFVFGLKQAELR